MVKTLPTINNALGPIFDLRSIILLLDCKIYYLQFTFKIIDISFFCL